MSSAGRPLHVLVAEDHQGLREGLVVTLEYMGFAVTGVGDGEAAVAHVLTEPTDLVLMDLGMPRVDGLEATRRIRAADVLQPHIIVLSGRLDSLSSQQAVEAGCDGYLLKGEVDAVTDAVKAYQQRVSRRHSGWVSRGDVNDGAKRRGG